MKEKLRILLDSLKEKLISCFVIHYSVEDKKYIKEDIDEIKQYTNLEQCKQKKKEINSVLKSVEFDLKERKNKSRTSRIIIK